MREFLGCQVGGEARTALDGFDAERLVRTTAEERRKDYEKQLLRELWEQSRTGEGTNQQQKRIADRYVRPGTLRLSKAAGGRLRIDF